MKISGAWVLIVIMVLASSLAMAADDDLDGIKDEFDGCPNTPYDAVLPLIKVNTEYLGCSCIQIEETLDKDLYCVDMYCFGGRQLSISERGTSAAEVNCGEDYCIGFTLYDVLESGFNIPGIIFL